MYTQCPRCETIFRVSAEILRAAAGQVRCGRCGAAFSALAHLEERPDDFPLAGSRLEQDRRAERILESGPDVDESDAVSAPDEAGTGDRIEQLRIVGPPFFPEDESLEFTVPPGDLDRVFIAPERGTPPTPHWPPNSSDATAPEEAEFEEIVIEATLEPPSDADLDTPSDGSAGVEAEPALEPEPAFEPEPAIESARPFEPEPPLDRDVATPSQAVPEPAEDGEPEAARGSAAAADAALLAAATNAVNPALPLDRPKRRAALALWSALAAILVLLLAAQIVNREREFIASHTPFGEPLRALYARLGLRLPIPADLHDYQLRQWGVTGDPTANGILRVRASILNTAAAFQPYPWLRVTLTDRFGNRVGTRDFAPREYLGKPPGLMAPGQRANATLGIVDPGKHAEGFEIDLCLRGDSGDMLCDTGGS